MCPQEGLSVGGGGELWSPLRTPHPSTVWAVGSPHPRDMRGPRFRLQETIKRSRWEKA